MRILLVQPEAPQAAAFAVRDRVAMTEPLALEYVAAGAKLDGHEVEILDLRLHPDELDRKLTSLQPDIVGVTAFSMHVPRALEICAQAKALVPDCRTAAGGVHASFEPRDFFEPQMDHVFVGPGIGAFRKVLSRLGRGEPATGIPGVHVRVGGEFEWGGEAPSHEVLPRPDRTLTPRGDRATYVIEHMKPIALMRTSVGCPYRCTFCSVWRMTDGRYFADDIEGVVEELKTIPEKHIHFTDDEPFVKPKRMLELAERIKAEGVEKEYFLYCRIDSFLDNLDVVKTWADIGLRCLFIGAESVFKEELERYNKGSRVIARLDEVTFINDKAKEMGIVPYFGFIVHPSYTHAEFEGLKKFIRERGLDYPSFTVWTPLPGLSDDGTSYDDVIELQGNGRPDWSKFNFFCPVTPTALPREEFMAQFNSLYVDLIHHEGSLGSIEERMRLEEEERKKQQYIRLARAVISGWGRQRPPA